MRLINRIRVFFGKEPQGSIWDAYRRLIRSMEMTLDGEYLIEKKKGIYQKACEHDGFFCGEDLITKTFLRCAEIIEKENDKIRSTVVDRAWSFLTQLKELGRDTENMRQLMWDILNEPSSLKVCDIYEKMLSDSLVLPERKEEGNEVVQEVSVALSEEG